MPLQFRRGAEADLPAAGDAAVGEPLFTTDSGKLYIKKANGTFAEIGDGSASAIDLSGLATGSLVRVNATQDGFDAANGGDLPSHTHSVANVTGLQAALDDKVDLDDLPQDANGVIDIARQSTLQDFIDDFPTDVNGNLDIARQTTLESFETTVLSVQASLAQTQADLDAAEATLASTAAITLTRAEASNGYLYFTTSGINGVPGSWSIQSPVFAAPEFIDGGDAYADQV